MNSILSSIKKSSFLHNVEQIFYGVAISFAVVAFSGLDPYWIFGPALLGAGGAVWWYEDYKYRLAAFVAVSVLAFCYFLGQPMIIGYGAITAGFAVFATMIWRKVPAKLRIPNLWLSSGLQSAVRWFLILLVLAIPSMVASASVLGIYGILVFRVFPVIHPYTQWLISDIGPVLLSLFTVLVVGFASLRQPSGAGSKHCFATPVMALVFAAFYMPTHSYIGMAGVVAVGFGLSVVAFIDRSTDETPHRSHKTFFAVTAVSVLFCGWFWLSNSWDWFLKYQMANAITVTKVDRLPPTLNTGIIPLAAARDYCAQGNNVSYTDLSENIRPIFIAKEGEALKKYWECLRYPTRLEGHLLTYPLGGIEGVIFVDAGRKGRFSSQVDVNFILGEESPYTVAAFDARHPGSTRQPAIVGRTASGEYYLLIPYTNKVPQLGGMIPVFGGVMVVSQNGLIMHLTPSQAGEMFPGVPLFPTELAREYANLWAQNSSFWDQRWTGEILEISDTGKGDNLFPKWQSFEPNEVYGEIPFEAWGKNSTAMKAVGLMDRVTGAMMIQVTAVAATKDVSSAAENAEMPGPKQITSNPASSHFGLNNVDIKDPTIVVSHRGTIYWLGALFAQKKEGEHNDPDQSKDKDAALLNHGYALSVLYDAHAAHPVDVETGAQIDEIVGKADALAAQKEAPAQKVQESAPAAKVQESAPAQKVQESAPAQKVQESAPAQEVQESAPAAKAQESAPAAKVQESAPAQKLQPQAAGPESDLFSTARITAPDPKEQESALDTTGHKNAPTHHEKAGKKQKKKGN